MTDTAMMDSDPTKDYTIASLLDSYSSAKLSVEQVVQIYLDRIEQYNPKLNAICAVSPTALEDAKLLDQYHARTGALKGALHGIPVVIKDQIETAGMPTVFGSAAAKAYVPARDATLVTKLVEAGAVVLGKATMPDWAAAWFSTSSLSGTTANPYALDRDPGGSSSGCASAVAGGLALVGIGGDTGGSIRLPSNFCRLVGVRCTPGRISRDGMSSLVATQDTPGPMVRCVDDAARVLDVLVGYDQRDEFTAINAMRPKAEFLNAIKGPDVRGTRIGVLHEAFGDHTGVVDTIKGALKSLENAGAELVSVDLPDLNYYKTFTSVYWTRSKSDINEFLSSRTSPDLPKAFSDFHSKNVYHPALDLIQVIASGPDDAFADPDYAKRLQAQNKFQRLVASLFASRELDAIVYPTCQLPAPKTEDVINGKWTCLGFPTNTVIASQLLFPALSVPVGFCKDEDASLPVGLEVLGLPLGEERIMRLAAAIEAVVRV